MFGAMCLESGPLPTQPGDCALYPLAYTGRSLRDNVLTELHSEDLSALPALGMMFVLSCARIWRCLGMQSS